MSRKLSDSRTCQERQAAFLAAFAKTGVIEKAVAESGVPYQHHRKWYKEDARYKEQFDELKTATREIARRSHSENVRAGVMRLTPEQLSERARNGHSAESDQKRRESMQRKWEDHEYRTHRAEIEALPKTKAHRSAGAIESNNRPGRRELQSQIMRDKFATDDDFRARHAIGMQLAADDPRYSEIRAETMREIAKEQWWRDAVSAGTKRHWREDRFYDEPYALGIPLTRYEVAVTRNLYVWNVYFLVHIRDYGPEIDILVPHLKLDIEVDGKSHLKKEAPAHDQVHNEHYITLGYTVLRIEHAKIDDGSFIPRLRTALNLDLRWQQHHITHSPHRTRPSSPHSSRPRSTGPAGALRWMTSTAGKAAPG